MMSSALCPAELARKFWQSCDVIFSATCVSLLFLLRPTLLYQLCFYGSFLSLAFQCISVKLISCSRRSPVRRPLHHLHLVPAVVRGRQDVPADEGPVPLDPEDQRQASPGAVQLVRRGALSFG